MTTQAHAEFDPQRMGVRIAVRDQQQGYYLTWQAPQRQLITESAQPSDDAWMRLDEDEARAIYEALADYLGHAGHDIRALRKDYDAERKRVDNLISYITKETA